MSARLGLDLDDLAPLAAGPVVGEAAAVALLLHGRGGSADDMLALARRIDLPGMAYLALPAPGGSWYPERFMAPLASNQPHLDQALARIESAVRAIEARGLPRARIALVGFSQGACLASTYLFRHPARWGALVALTGGLIGPPETTFSVSGSLDGTPALFATADPDSWVPVERVRQTAELFRATSAEVDLRVYPGAGHLVTDDAVRATQELLARLLDRPGFP
ncbi:MAG TPA: dienelactone hydrolase family protein [Polyangia bacterium]|nr:dienelactone hydrolase family protein [Polyangia bacterium]